MRSAPSNRHRDFGGWLAAIGWGGAVAGVLDILFALIFYSAVGSRPIAILQSVAAGLLGRSAYAGGWGTALLGLALHFLIAFTAAAVFCAAARWWPFLLRRVWLTGPSYGLLVWLVMNAVVLPASALGPGRFPPPHSLPAILAHLFLVGLPIAWAARRFLGRELAKQ